MINSLKGFSCNYIFFIVNDVKKLYRGALMGHLMKKTQGY